MVTVDVAMPNKLANEIKRFYQRGFYLLSDECAYLIEEIAVAANLDLD